MKAFALMEPNTVEEALSLLDTDDPSVRCIAGGTALMQMMKSKLFEPERLISLHGLKQTLSHVYVSDTGDLHMGAMASLRDLEVSPIVSHFSPVITEALKTLSNVRVRNVATLGGHIAHGDPHMDLPPILLALNARVQLRSRSATRELALSDFLIGYYTTALQNGELITDVIVPAMPKGMQGTYLKYTALSMDDWPMAGVAAYMQIDHGGITDVRLAVSAATEKPIRLEAVESHLIGQHPTEETFSHAAELSLQHVRPLADIRGSAAYKQEIVKICIRRSLEHVASQSGNGGTDHE